MKTRLFFALACMMALLLAATVSQESPLGGESAVSGANAAPAEIEAFAASAAAAAPWFRNTVDSPNDVGQHVSVAADPSSGTTYISYYDTTNKDLRMAKHVGFGGNCGSNNDWACETVDSGGDVGQYSSIAFSTAAGVVGGPGIAYYDADNYALKYAAYACDPYCAWDIYTITPPQGIANVSNGKYASLKYHSNGAAVIAYYRSVLLGDDSLWTAYYQGANGNCGEGAAANLWQCDLIDSGNRVGQYASLSLGSDDSRRIAYYDGGDNALMYAYEYGGGWLNREILPVNSGKYASLVVDVNNENLPHIAHFNATNNRLEYAVYDVSGNGNCGFYSDVTKFMWQCDAIEDIGSSSAPRGVDIAVDGAGLPIIAYQNTAEGPQGTLKVARPVAALNQLVGNCGPAPSLFYTWQCDTLLPLGPIYNIHYRPADYIGIDLNSAGLATIAYYGNATNDGGNLQVTYQMLQTFLPLIVKD